MSHLKPRLAVNWQLSEFTALFVPLGTMRENPVDAHYTRVLLRTKSVLSLICLITIYHIHCSVYMDKELTGALGNVLVWYVARLQLVSSMGQGT